MERMSQVNASNGPGNYWCHTCKSKVTINVSHDHEITCKDTLPNKEVNNVWVGSQCNGLFCEMLENDYTQADDPMSFEPYHFEPDNGLENSLEELSLHNHVLLILLLIICRVKDNQWFVVADRSEINRFHSQVKMKAATSI